MRDIHVDSITEKIAELCIESNIDLKADIRCAFCEALDREENGIAREVIQVLLENADIAREERLPICQDTGMVVVFLEWGQEVHLIGGSLEKAIHAGVAQGYEQGYLRKSVVRDPLDRINTGDNTPAVIHTKIVPGDRLKITVAPKGFGSENMSRVFMLRPADGLEGIRNAVLQSVQQAGPNPCPPIILGLGIGGTMEKAAILAKEALLRPLGEKNPLPFWAELEHSLLQQINALGIGPGGFGGKTTALGVHINVFPTHIAGLPLAINFGCHVTRHSECLL